jgi:hypothetical protein
MDGRLFLFLMGNRRRLMLFLPEHVREGLSLRMRRLFYKTAFFILVVSLVVYPFP